MFPSLFLFNIRKKNRHKNKFFFSFCIFLYSFSILLFLSSCASTPEPTAEIIEPESLIDLISAGKIDTAKQRLTSAESINQTNEQGQSLLHIAALHNNVEMVRFLLSQHAELDSRDSAGNTPLATAIQENSLQAASILAEAGSQIYLKNSLGNTVLDTAYTKGIATVRAIVFPATIRQKDEDGNTILHKTVEKADLSTLDHILSLEPLDSVKNNRGETALAIAYKQPQKKESAKIAAELLLAGAEPLRGDFLYFETAIIKRNPNMRFEEGKTPLHFASEKGHLGFILYLLEKQVQVNIKDVASSTPLHEAVRNGHIKCTETLLNAGADPNQRDSAGNTALHLVMPTASRSSIFDLLLHAQANPNIKDNAGETALHITARLGMSEDIIESLIRFGADINERNKRGSTPLALAIERNHRSQAQFFVHLGADIHAEDMKKSTALTSALESNAEMVQAVINNKNIQSRDSQGKTPLHIAVENQAEPSIISHFLQLKADVNARDKNGDSPIHIATRNNDRTSGEVLLAHNADVFTPNVHDESALKIALTQLEGRQDWVLNSNIVAASDGAGNTPMHLAAEWKLSSIIPFIVEKGGNVNAKNSNGETPLFNAVKANSKQTIQTMFTDPLDEKININARDFLGNTAIHAGIRWGSTEAVETLMYLDSLLNANQLIQARNLAGKTALHEASRAGNINFMNLLLSSGADIHAVDETGKTPLTDAIQENQTNAIVFLLENRASPIMQDMYGRTPLHEAVETGNTDIIRTVRNAGGNPMARDSFGKTPLSLAYTQTEPIILAVLGTTTNLVDSDGNTAVHIAINEHADAQIIQSLINKGFSVNNRNRFGATALLLAIRENQEASARYLFAAQANPFETDSKGENAISLILTEKQEFLPLAIEHASTLTDTFGDSILHYAARMANTETIKKILTNPKINRATKNIAGETAYDMAVRWGKQENALLLK